ncbi:MAG: glycosyltransferase [Parachlamydiaceae bacterium]|nr:glycosyltransferase [Parachlamydiaceae bacterium]
MNKSLEKLRHNQKTIGVFGIKKSFGSWDSTSIQSGLFGSEEAVVYMSHELVKLGYKVIVFGDPPLNSPCSQPNENPLYLTESNYNDYSLDIAIFCGHQRLPDYLRKVAPKRYLWPHDTHTVWLPAEYINDFDDVLWISNYLREQWISINPLFAKFTKIFGNGINPDQFMPIHERINPYSCIYGSNYGRGLDLLLDIWPSIKEQFTRATLDIYYGWQSWGILSPEKVIKMQKQVKALKSLDVHEHGVVGHESLHRAYENASFWTYPCTGIETFCISALKAQFAGAVPVIIEGSALKETVRYGYKCISDEDYCSTLQLAMQDAETITLKDRKTMGQFILHKYTWNQIAKKWKNLFDTT